MSSGILASDEYWMRRAIELAKRGEGTTYPNPIVGALIVKGGALVSEGYHERAGGPHAEVCALRSSRKPVRGACLYVTLEPCSSHGRTPPCTEAIREAGIGRVVYGATDPNPRHAGRAKEFFCNSGIEVVTGVLGKECEELNRAWNKWIATGLPYVIAKAGMSLDGRIKVPAGRRWITSVEARRDAMRLRAGCDAVLVGGQTIRDDNPRLTVRGVRRPPVRPPLLRAVWTRSGRLPTESRIFTDKDAGLTRIFKNVPLREALAALGREGVQKCLIEGGGRTLGEAFDQGLVDEVVIYLEPVFIGGDVAAVSGRGAGSPEEALWLEGVSVKKFDTTLRLAGRARRSGCEF